MRHRQHPPSAAGLATQADVHGDERTLVTFGQHVDREIVENAAVDEETLLVAAWREEAREC